MVALASQRTDIAAMQTKSKDLIGLITLAGTFLSVLGRDQTGAFIIELSADPWQLGLFVALPVLILLLCLFVLAPTPNWVFYIRSVETIDDLAERGPFSKNFEFYAAYVKLMTGWIDKNNARLGYRRRALLAAMVGLVCEVSFIILKTVY